MLSFNEMLLLLNLILLLEYLLGILINTFIAAVLSLDWAKSQHLKSCDGIGLVIGVSRVVLLSADFGYTLLIIGQPGLYVPVWMDKVYGFIGMFLSFSSFWFTALLYVYYCAMVATFRQPLFTRLKARIPHLMPRLLLGCFAASLVSALPSPWAHTDMTITISTVNLLHNISWEDSQSDMKYLHLGIYYALGYSPPFLIFCGSAVLLIASLYRHTKRMQRSASDFNPPRLDAHYRAVKSVVSFFFLFAVYFAACLCLGMNMMLFGTTGRILHPVVTEWYPFLHSALLIRNYPKLNQAAARIIRHAGCWKQIGPSEE
ncbi:taste receptor type 2 member 9-like [Ambystoma mexicanum]|uniref:taste receptor type 2 member 9-like n=1 Tax=Ambystoma mexicanum TaxID=8296 RepID=UPI0037E8C536